MQFKIKRGTNISHWLSQSEERGAVRRSRFTKQDAEALAAAGLDHLRLPFDEVQMWDESGAQIPEAWDLLEEALGWTLALGMNAVVDLHILRSHFFNAQYNPLFHEPKEEAKFADLWKQISAKLSGYGNDRVAYELMNEPVAKDPADWNRVARTAYDAIRALEKERTVFYGSNLWNSVDQFEFLDVPERDRNLVLTFHYYLPMGLTHYRAPWMPEMRAYAGPIQYPGQPIPQSEFDKLPPDLQSKIASRNTYSSKERMATDLMWPLAVSARTGLPLYCGEFGAIDLAPDPLRRVWIREFREVMEERGIAWANWDFKFEFGLLTPDLKPTAIFEGLMGS